MKATKNAQGKNREDLGSLLPGDEIYRALDEPGLDVLQHFKCEGNVIIVEEMLDHLDNNDDGEITIDEFIDGLLHPTRTAGPTSEPGVVLTTVKISGNRVDEHGAIVRQEVPGTKFYFTLDGSEPHPMRSATKTYDGGIEYYRSVDPYDEDKDLSARDDVLIRAIAVEPGRYDSLSAEKVISFPTLHTPEIFVMPEGTRSYKVKITCGTPAPPAVLHFSEGHAIPTVSDSPQYVGTPMRRSMKLSKNKCLVVRARAFIEEGGDLIGSAVGQLRLDVSGMGLAAVQKTSDHTFSLVSTARWIGTSSRGVVTKHQLNMDDHNPLDDESTLQDKYKTMTGGMNMPQTQLWLRRQTNFRNDDGWESSEQNPVHQARLSRAQRRSMMSGKRSSIKGRAAPSATGAAANRLSLPALAVTNPRFEHEIELGLFSRNVDGSLAPQAGQAPHANDFSSKLDAMFFLEDDGDGGIQEMAL
jgi:hypothetical protein